MPPRVPYPLFLPLLFAVFAAGCVCDDPDNGCYRESPAADGCRLTGVVTDEGGRPLHEIRVCAIQGSIGNCTQTDLAGGFAIGLPAEIRIAPYDVCAYDVDVAANGGIHETTCAQVEANQIEAWVELRMKRE